MQKTTWMALGAMTTILLGACSHVDSAVERGVEERPSGPIRATRMVERSPTPAILAPPPESTPTPTAPPFLPTEEVTGDEDIPFPYLPADQILRLNSLDMVDPLNGWAVYDPEDGAAHVLRTSDGGATWVDVTPPVTLHYDDVVQGPGRFKVAARFLDVDHAWVSLMYDALPTIYSVWRTIDGGRHWEEGVLGRRTSGIDWIRFEFVDPTHGWAITDTFLGAGSHTGELFRTTDGGSTWETLLGRFGNASGIKFLNRQVGWITTDAPEGYSPTWGLSITRDGGLTWQTTFPAEQPAADDPTRDHSECDFDVLEVSSALSGVVDRPACTVQDNQGNLTIGSWLDYTADGGRTWQTAQKPGGSPDFIKADVGWAIGATDWQSGPMPLSLFKTRDGGRTWQPVSEVDWSGYLDFVDERNGWGIDYEGTLRRTKDGGVTWVEVLPQSIAGTTPENVTAVLDLPPDLAPITRTNASQLQLIATLPANDPTSLLFFRNELFVGNALGQLLHWDLGPLVHEQPAIWRVHTDWVYDLAAVDAGGDLFSASRDGLIRRWALFQADGWWQEFPIHSGEVTSVALSPNGSMLASGGEDGTIKVQEIPSTAPPQIRLDLRSHQGWVWDVAFSSDGRILASASGDRTVKLWASEAGTLLDTLSGHTSTVSQVAFSPHGDQLASASWDGTVRIWDATTHDLLHVLEGHADWVLGLAYTPRGDLLVSTGADGRILVWDPANGRLVSQLTDLGVPIRDVAFDSQGQYMAAIADDDRVFIWGVVP